MPQTTREILSAIQASLINLTTIQFALGDLVEIARKGKVAAEYPPDCKSKIERKIWRKRQRDFLSNQARKLIQNALYRPGLIARAFKPKHRDFSLSWAHYEAAAKLSPQVRVAMIKRAKAKGWSVIELRAEIRKRSQTIPYKQTKRIRLKPEAIGIFGKSQNAPA